MIYDIGGPVSYVYFPHTGDVGLSFRPRRRSSGSVNPYDESHGVDEYVGWQAPPPLVVASPCHGHRT